MPYNVLSNGSIMLGDGKMKAVIKAIGSFLWAIVGLFICTKEPDHIKQPDTDTTEVPEDDSDAPDVPEEDSDLPEDSEEDPEVPEDTTEDDSDTLDAPEDLETPENTEDTTDEPEGDTTDATEDANSVLIEDLDLGTRATNELKEEKIFTVGDIKKFVIANGDLQTINGVGPAIEESVYDVIGKPDTW